MKASFFILGWWLSTIAIGCTILNLSFIPVLVASFPPGAAPILPPQVVMSLIGFCLGTIGAEPGLLAIFAVFGPGPAWRRQLVAVFLALLLAILLCYTDADNYLACVAPNRLIDVTAGVETVLADGTPYFVGAAGTLRVGYDGTKLKAVYTYPDPSPFGLGRTKVSVVQRQEALNELGKRIGL